MISSISKTLNNKNVFPYLFIGFPILLVLSMELYPLINAFTISLFRYRLFEEDKRPFIGLDNYIDLLSDKVFHNAFLNTMEFAVKYVVFGLVIGLILALAVYHISGALHNLVKTLYFMPVVISMVPVTIVFSWLLRSGGNMGPINYYLTLLGMDQVNFLSDERYAFSSVLFITLWKNAGFLMIIYLSGLLNIPRSYYESAEIDGANGWESFWYITIPLLRHTTIFLIVTGFIGAFQVFTQVFVLVGGAGPNGSCSTLGYEIYYRAFNTYNMGSASAMGFVMFFFILLATALQLKYFGGDKT